jgi:hypothetical protein
VTGYFNSLALLYLFQQPQQLPRAPFPQQQQEPPKEQPQQQQHAVRGGSSGPPDKEELPAPVAARPSGYAAAAAGMN